MNVARDNVISLMRHIAPVEPGVPTVSVIIPVVGDSEGLAKLLDYLTRLDSPPQEIVVVDGGAGARCRSLARRFRCIYVATRPGRGHQLHAGALRASGDVLWFLHADARPPTNGIPLIRAQCVAGQTGGWFRFRFAGRRAWYKSLLEGLINWRTRFGVPYGDQGLFMSRVAYDAVGGFADVPLFEEVALVRALRRRGGFGAVPAAIGVSPRRWERDGWLHRTLANRLLALAFALGVSPHRLARRYRPLGDIEGNPDGNAPADFDDPSTGLR
jgi:rSAM/selenodomain-associated transferase 2